MAAGLILVAVIATLAGAGALLFLLGRWVVMRRMPGPRRENAMRRVTAAGFAVYGIMTFALMALFSLPFLAPTHWAAPLLNTSFGRLIGGCLVAAVFSLVGRPLQARGITLVEHTRRSPGSEPP